jgi:hypothetical protein
LEKVERFHPKFWRNLLEEAPPLTMGQPMVLFNPISIHVGVNNLLLTVTDVTDVTDVTITGCDGRDRCDSSNSFLALEFPIVS